MISTFIPHSKLKSQLFFIIALFVFQGQLSAQRTATATPAVICSGDHSIIQLAAQLGSITWETDASGTYQVMPGRTSDTLLTPNLTTTTHYRAITQLLLLKDTSTIATVSIAPFSAGGTISVNPGLNICSGTAVTLTLDNSIGNIQWELDTTGTFVNISGAETSPYTTPPLSKNVTYRATVTSSTCPSAPSTTALINVTPSSVGGLAKADTSMVCKGTGTTIHLTGNTGPAILWQIDTTGSFVDISGATGTSYATGPINIVSKYRARVTNGSCAAAFSSEAQVSVTPESIGGQTSNDTTICSNNSVSIGLKGNQGAIQWQIDTTGIFVNISGANAKPYSTPILTKTSKFRAKISSGTCPAAFSTVTTVTVNPGTTPGTITADLNPLCSGSATTLHLTGATSGATIQWQSKTTGVFTDISGANSATYPTGALTTTTSYQAIVTANNCPATASPITVTVNPIPTPGTVTADVNPLCSGNGTTIHLTGTTPGATIQWQSKTTGVFADISGANSATYPTGTLTTTTSYQAIVTANNCPATASPITITVNPTPTAGTVAADANPLCAGSNTNINLTGSTPGATIQWQSKTTGVFADISGANSGTYPTGALTTTTSYQAIVTANNCSVTAGPITVTVNPLPTPGTVTADVNPLCSGNGTTIHLTGATPAATIQWQSKTTGVFADISGANSATYPTGTLTTTTSYQAIVTVNNCSVTAGPITVIVNPTPTAGSAAADASPLCTGNSTNIVLTGATTGATIQWQSKTTGVYSNISGANAATYPTGGLSTTTTYQAIVSINGCSVTSNPVTVVINNAATPGTAAADNNPICNGNGTNINLTGYTPGATIQWQSKTTGVFADISGANSATYPTGTLNTTTTYQAIVTANNCSAFSNPVTVVVNIIPTPGTVTADINPLCSGNSTTIHLTGATPGATIQWQSKTTGIFANINGATAANYPTGVLNTTTSYQAVVTNNNCSAITTPLTVTVNPSPTAGTAAAGTSPLCSGNGTTISLSGATGGATIQWQSKTTGVFADISGANSPNYPTGALTTTTIYQAVVTLNNCSATSNPVTVTVNPIPSPGTAAADLSAVCSGSSTQIKLTGAPGGATFQWQSKTTGVFANISGATSAAYPTGTLTTTTSYQVIVTVNNCSATSNPVTVTVNPNGTSGTAMAGVSILCEGDSTVLSLTGYSGAIQWQSKTTGAFNNISGATSDTYNTHGISTTTTYRAVVGDNGCTVNSNPVTVTVNPKPVGGNVTPSATTTCTGNSVTLTLKNYVGQIQWQTNASGSFADIDQENDNTYDTPNLTATTKYQAVLSSPGCPSITSTIATITIAPMSQGGDAIATPSVICNNQTTTITLQNYTGTSIQWQRKVSGTYVNVPQGLNSNTFTTPALTSATSYQAVVKSANCPVANSSEAFITIAPSAVGGTATADSSTICSGSITAIRLTGYIGTSIQWQSDESGSGYSDIATNGNSNVYQVIGLTKTTNYKAIVKSNNCPTAESTVAKVKITPPAVGGTITATPPSVCSGATSKLTLSGYTGTDIKWQKNVSGSFVTISGAIGPEYTTIALTDDTEYRAVVTNGHCASINSGKVTVTIIPALDGGTAAADLTSICSGTSTTIRLTGQTGVYQWQKDDGSGFTDIPGAINAPYSTPNLTVTTKYRAVVSGGSCASVNSTVTTVVITPASNPGTVLAAKNIVCSGTGTTVTLSGYVGSISWQVDDSGTGTGPFADVGSSATTYSTPGLTKKTRYRAKVTQGSCASVFSAPVTIDVAPVSVAGTISSSAMAVCPGSTVTLTLNGSAGTIQWLSDTSGTFTNIPQATTTPYTTFPITKETSFRAVVTNGSCASVATAFITISIAPALSGGTAIPIPATVCKGSNTSIRLRGYTGSIQWQTDASGVFTDIQGETDTMYITPNLTVGTKYRAILSSGNCPTATSTEAVVTVIPASVGGTANATSTTVCSGTGTTVTLSGNIGSIQWQSDTSGVFKDIPGATNVTCNTGPLTKNTSFRAVVTSNGCSSIYSLPVFISVTPASFGGFASALQPSVCSGGTATVNLTGEVGAQIIWQSDASGAYADIPGATGKTHSTTLTALTHFRARVKNGSCATATSNVVTISITPALHGGTAKATPSSVCRGTTTSIKLSGHTGPDIQWQTNASGSYVDMPGERDSILITPPLSVATNFRAHVNGSGCPQVTSIAASVSIIPLSAGGTVNAVPSTICSGETSKLTLSGNVGTIQWQSDETGIFADITGEKGQSYTTPPLNNSTSYQAIVTSGSCAADKSTTTLVSVVPSSVSGFAKATPSTVCSGGTTKLTLTGYVGNKIQWQTDASGTFQDIGGATDPEYITPALTVPTTFRAVVSNGNCASIESNTVTITITSILKGGLAEAVQSPICKGTYATIKLAGQSGNIQWQTNASGVFKDIATNANSNTLNTPNLTVPTSYRAVLTSGGCAPQYSNTVDIFIIPASVGGVATPKYATVCSGERDTITLSGHIGSIQWQIDTTGAFVNIPGATATSYGTLPLTVATSYQAIVTSTGCAQATSSEASVSVAPASKPGIASASALKVCSGATSNLTLTGYIGVIHWQSDASGSFVDIPGGIGMMCTTPPLYTTTNFRALVTNGNCKTLSSNVITISIIPALSSGTLTANPTTVCKGTSSTISVADHSGAIRWQTNSSGSWIDIDTLTATDTFYVTPHLLVQTSYRVVVSSSGCASAISTPVTVFVSPASTAGSAVATPSSICNGDPSTISLTGYTGTIKWQTNASGKFVDIPLATGSSYKTPGLTKSTSYRAIVTNGSCLPDTSNIVVISIIPASVGGVPTATATTVCVGGTSTISLTKYTGTTIQWQRDSLTTFVDIPSALGPFYSTLPLSAATTYRAIVTNGKNCPSAISSPITILVTDELQGGVATVIPSTVCDNTPTTLNLANYKGSIQWQRDSLNNFVNIPGAVTTPYTTAPLTANTKYQALVTSGTCPSVLSNTVTAYVTPALSPGVITATPSAICAGEGTKLTIKGYTGNVQWQRDSIKTFVNIPGQTADTCMINALTTSTKFRAKISSGNCTPVYADSILINVNVVTSPTGDSVQKFCSLTVPTIKNLTAGSVGDSIKWYAAPTGGTALAPSKPLVNGGVYFATRSVFGCESYNRFKVTVTVAKSANVLTQPVNVITCPGLNTRFTITGDGAGFTYKWMVDETGTGTYKYITDNSTYKGSATDTLKVFNVDNFMNGYSYKCVVKGTCSSTDSALSNAASLAINANTTINAQPSSISMCYGASALFNVNASGSALSYQWQIDSTLTFVNLKNDSTYKNVNGAALNITAFDASMASYQFRCAITSAICGTVVYSEPVTISYDEDCNIYPLKVPTGFSPDGDGINDKLVIEGIENYPGSTLRIFNSWGDLVYEQTNYKNDWDAKANVKNVVGSGKLPAGTYYMYLDLKGNKKGKATFLIIKY